MNSCQTLILLSICIYRHLFFSAVPLCVCLEPRPGDSWAVADLCLPGWVQASCCFISPRVLWHLSLFTCSEMVIPSDRVSNLSSVFVSAPPLPASVSTPSTSELAAFSSANLAVASDILTLAFTGMTQCELNLLRDPTKRTLSVKRLSAGDEWRYAGWDCCFVMLKMRQPLQSLNYFNGLDRAGARAATVAQL